MSKEKTKKKTNPREPFEVHPAPGHPSCKKCNRGQLFVVWNRITDEEGAVNYATIGEAEYMADCLNDAYNLGAEAVDVALLSLDIHESLLPNKGRSVSTEKAKIMWTVNTVQRDFESVLGDVIEISGRTLHDGKRGVALAIDDANHVVAVSFRPAEALLLAGTLAKIARLALTEETQMTEMTREQALDILLWQDIRNSQELLEALLAERSRAHDLAVPHDDAECDSLAHMKTIAMNARFGFVQLAPVQGLLTGIPVEDDGPDMDEMDEAASRPVPVHRATTKIKNWTSSNHFRYCLG